MEVKDKYEAYLPPPTIVAEETEVLASELLPTIAKGLLITLNSCMIKA